MKAGNFVGKECLVMDEKDMCEYRDMLIKEFAEYGMDYRGCRISDARGTRYPYCQYFYTFQFAPRRTSGFHPYRNWKGDRIMDFDGVEIALYYESGYLEQRTANNEIIKTSVGSRQFQAVLSVKGHRIPFGCRRKDVIELRGHFDYDTDVMQLDFKDCIKELFTEILPTLKQRRSSEKNLFKAA